MEHTDFDQSDPNDYSLLVQREGLDLLWTPDFNFDWDLFSFEGPSLDSSSMNLPMPTSNDCSTSPDQDLLPESSQANGMIGHGRSLSRLSKDTQNCSLHMQRPEDVQHTESLSHGTLLNDLSPDGSSEKESLKRKISESMFVFSTKSSMEVKPKKRRAFSKSRKVEVALNRLLGACVQCKIRKGSCSSDMPCEYCINRAGNIELGGQICTRQSLVSARFDRLDLFRVTALRSSVQKVRANRDITPAGEMYLGYQKPRNTNDDLSFKSFIKVPLVRFSWATDPGVNLVISYDYYDIRYTEIQPEPLAIAFEFIPSVDKLVDLYNASAQVTNRGPFRGVQEAFKQFAEYYIKTVADVPIKSLLEKALRLQTLFAIYTKGLVMKQQPDSKEFLHASTSIAAQLSYVISKEIISTEVAVLAEVDKLLYGPDGIGRRNPLVFWVCLWTLILSYKHQMVFADAFFSGGDYYNLAAHVYNSLTSIYAALYKTTSPLNFDWRISENAEIFGNDPTLVKLFCNIKTEMFWFHLNSDRLYREDALFKSLVIENESKLVRAHLKAAKKKGFL